MKSREQVVTECFNSWMTKDASVFMDTFAPNAIYIESWGPAYRNRIDILKWFNEWNSLNTVLQWDITNFIHQDNCCVCEWFFKCECNGNIDGFNGVSIIVFNDNGRIISLKEFQSKAPNYYPYE